MKPERECPACGGLSRRIYKGICAPCYERAYSRQYRHKYQNATKAHYQVSAAVYRGDLPRLHGDIPCVDCGYPAKFYDHRDYLKPLDVQPVCGSCNKKRGPGLNREAA